MKRYSNFFTTLHDEQARTGTNLGRGTHYSVLRAVVFHDSAGKPLDAGQFLDFAIVWDEDHDDRVIEPIEKIYLDGLLSRFVAFGERKGGFTAISASRATSQSQQSRLHEQINAITRNLWSDDSWPARIVGLGDEENPIISDEPVKTRLYLSNLMMLWELGLKKAVATRTVSSADQILTLVE